MKGKLIVFEGTDGSGKATQSQLLCERLAREGVAYKNIEGRTFLIKTSTFPGTANPLPPWSRSIWTVTWAAIPAM